MARLTRIAWRKEAAKWRLTAAAEEGGGGMAAAAKADQQNIKGMKNGGSSIK